MSMQELYESPLYEDTQTCNLASALNAAMEIEKRKIIVGPNDSVGIMLFNTVRDISPYWAACPNESTRPGKQKVAGMHLKSKRAPICSSQSRP